MTRAVMAAEEQVAGDCAAPADPGHRLDDTEGVLGQLRPVLQFRWWGPKLLIAAGALILWSAAIHETRTHGVFMVGAHPDYGSVRIGSPVWHTFRMWNSTVLPARYSAVKGCGCADIANAEGVIPPFGVGVFTLYVDTAGQEPGPKERGAQIVYTAGDKRWEQLVSVRYSAGR